MAAAPIKFRCFQCNQLLGVSRSKAGAVVACPKCQIDLVVPEPEEPATRSTTTSSTGSTDGGISLEVLNIRPEDIRVEPESSPVVTFPSAPISLLVEPPGASLSVDELMTAGEISWPSTDAAPEVRRGEPPSAAPPSASVAPIVPQRTAGSSQPEELPTIPEIQIDASPSSSRSRLTTTPVRTRDLVLPRSVVASWSLLVLFGIAFAFTAGLLAGHYVWRVH